MPSRRSMPDSQTPIAAEAAPDRSSPACPARLDFRDGLLAVLIALLAQLIIAGIQHGLDEEGIDFPASILAMAGVFAMLSVFGWVIPGMEVFYRQRLKRAADLLNRHMSIGFTVPFIMIFRGPFSDAQTIGAVILCFVLTGILNTLFAYFLALPLQCLMVLWDDKFWAEKPSDVETGEGQKPHTRHNKAKSFCEGSAMGSSPSIDLYLPGEESSTEGNQAPPQPSSYSSRHPTIPSRRILLLNWALRNPILLLCWLVTLAVGIPHRHFSQNSVPLSASLLCSLWLTTLALQTGIKSCPNLPRWLRTLLSGLSNPVLWTSLAMTAYLFLDGAASNRPLQAMLDTLETHTPLSKLILRALSDSSAAATTATPPAPASPSSSSSASHQPTSASTTTTTTMGMAAGDIAVTILNSGLVAWGLKLYEYRGHLLSRAGVTVLSVSAALALANVACGPLLARAVIGVGVGVGSPPPDPASHAALALAFAARSVTIALGGPAMAALGGDAGLNAAMVVVSGIVFQMALGFGVGSWLEGCCCRRWWWWEGRRRRRSPRRTGDDDDVEMDGAATSAAAQREDGADAGAVGRRRRRRVNDPRTVAAGVMVGVNAAAMGTAYLYEAQSDAAPHSALSMMALGIMTVVFSAITPLARWVAESVAA